MPGKVSIDDLACGALKIIITGVSNLQKQECTSFKRIIVRLRTQKYKPKLEKIKESTITGKLIKYACACNLRV